MVFGDDYGLSYPVWDGLIWSGKQALPLALSAAPQQLQLASHPYEDEMVLTVGDAAGGAYAVVWNGSGWGSPVTLGGAGSDTDIAVAYEQQSGDALVVYGKGTKDVFLRQWNGGWWLDEISMPAPTWPIAATGNIVWATAAPDPRRPPR